MVVVAAVVAAAEVVAAVVAEADLTAHLGGRLTVNWQWRFIGLYEVFERIAFCCCFPISYDGLDDLHASSRFYTILITIWLNFGVGILFFIMG